jgi:hypothetical protein
VVALVAASAVVAVAEPPERGADGKGKSRFDIALIGDFPYAPGQEEQADNLLDELNGEKLAFVGHVGDIKSGSSACTDDVYAREFERFESSGNPFFYTPGDNEWTDCHRPPNPSPEEADPLNRLALVRSTFFTDDESLGERTLPLRQQSEEYPENARWGYGGITFATLHVVGSNNNRPTADNPSIGNEGEWRARNEANMEWLREVFEEAERRDSAAVVLLIQANIFEEDTNEPSGFAEFREALKHETIAFEKPILLVHGDSHYFRVDKPLLAEEGDEDTRVMNFTRAETYGDADVHWIRASVDTRDPEVFTFQPEVVEENVAP